LQSQGNPDADGCTLARAAVEVDQSADPADFFPDHIHADPTTGELRYNLFGGKTGQ